MDPRIERRTRSCRFEPPDTFLQDVLRLHGTLPSSERVRAPRDRPEFHADMDPDTLDAYLCWRRDLAAGADVPQD